MAKHETRMADDIYAAMESRFQDLLTLDQYNGQYAGEYAVLESVLADTITDEESDITEDKQFDEHFATSSTVSGGLESGGGYGDSRSVAGSPHLLTGGFPSTVPQDSPISDNVDVPEYSHGGFDGGVMVGFDGTWNPLKFSELLDILKSAKEQAIECTENGLEGFPLELYGHEVLVCAKGGFAGGDDAKGGVVYSYRFFSEGVQFMIHSNPGKHIQPVRVRYDAESIQGDRKRFYDVHFGFVVPFLKQLGLVISSDKLSRVDMQCLIDVPVSEFSALLDGGHAVTKLRKKAVYGSMKRVETIELGSVGNVQFCFYDKGRELRAKKSNVVKEALFVRDCVGDEWYNSDRPITRIEIRLGRDALRCFGVSSVSDLQERERGIVDLLTSEWLRFLASPKVRGHENSAALHPLWERVRALFFQYFTGSTVRVRWEKKESLVCDPAALERQALGCLSKALAYSFGEQFSVESSVELGGGWVERVGEVLHAKLNACALSSRCKTGLSFGTSVGVPAGYDVELDDGFYGLDSAVVDRKRGEIDSWIQSLGGVR